ncbi:MAG: hypothetical protein ACREO1_08670 [Arenimonas sp.]
MKVQLFALMLAVAAPLSAQAADNKSFIEFGYAQTGTPLTDLYSFAIHDYRGAAIKGQWAFSEKWNLNLGYTEGSSGNSAVDLDSKWTLGLGFHHPVSDKVDLVVAASYSDVNEQFTGTDIDTQVWGAEVGVAGRGAKWSGGAALGYETWDADVGGGVIDDDQGYVRLNGGFHFNDNWSLQAEYKVGFGESNSAFIGARYSF